MLRKTLPMPALLFGLAGLASAQGTSLPSFNLDIGSLGFGTGTPESSYAAAGPSAGSWTPIDTDLFEGLRSFTSAPLADASGATTAVTFEWDSTVILYALELDEPNTSGDDDALMDDIGYGTGPSVLRLTGLPAGTYDVITYAMAPDDPAYKTSISVPGSSDPVQHVGGSFASGFALGVTHAYHTVTVTAGAALSIEIDIANEDTALNGLQVFPSIGGIGTSFCGPAVPNSSGSSARISVGGSQIAANNTLALTCTQMPRQVFGFFLTSRSQGLVVGPGGSQGNLCLGGAIGRFVAAGQITNSGLSGEIRLPVDLGQIPQPSGFVQVQSGETWSFTAWFRDSVGGAATSNFSDGASLTFQ